MEERLLTDLAGHGVAIAATLVLLHYRLRRLEDEVRHALTGQGLLRERVARLEGREAPMEARAIR